MPCTYYTPGEEAAMAQAELNKATRLLCYVMSHIDSQLVKALTNRNLGKNAEDLKKWWVKHQEMDRRRLAAEKARQEMKQLKARALSKLTPMERQALKS